MLAWVETVGLAVAGSPFSAVALRAGFIVLFAGSTWLLWRIAGRWYGPWAGFYAALALNLTGYYGLAASTFALPDGPLLFFWLLTIDRLGLALEQPRRTVPWLWVGLAWGGAMLSKYHAIFLPAGTLLSWPCIGRCGTGWPGRGLTWRCAGPSGLQPGDRLERDARMGLVPVPGRQGRGRIRPPPRLSGDRSPGPDGIPLSLDLAAHDGAPDPRPAETGGG